MRSMEDKMTVPHRLWLGTLFVGLGIVPVAPLKGEAAQAERPLAVKAALLYDGTGAEAIAARWCWFGTGSSSRSAALRT